MKKDFSNSGMGSQCIILLSALGPLREALYRAEMALESGAKVTFVCFRRDIAEFLQPLKSERVEVHLHEEQLAFWFGSIWRDIRAIKQFQKKLAEKYLGNGGTVWCYGSSISLSSIIALIFFAMRGRVFYNGVYEGREAKDGIFYSPTKKWIRKAKAWLLSRICGGAMDYVRDWSPVPVLKQEYIDQHTQPAPPWNPNMLRCDLEKKLLRPCNSEILLLFTNYSNYYQSDGKDRRAFEQFCKQLKKSLQNYLNRGVAVKPHPTSSQIPDDWDEMEQFDPGFPLEFLDLSKVRVILGDASTSMISPMKLDQKPVLSYAYLIETSWANEVQTYLEERVDKEGRIARPRTWEELSSMLAVFGS